MAVTNITDLQNRAEVVAAETAEGANSKNRIGQLFRDLTDTLWSGRGIPIVNLSNINIWGIQGINMNINDFLNNPNNWRSYVQGGGGCVIQVLVSPPAITGVLIIDIASQWKQTFISGIRPSDDGLSIDLNKGASIYWSNILMRSGNSTGSTWQQWKYVLRGDRDVYGDIETIQTTVGEQQDAIVEIQQTLANIGNGSTLPILGGAAITQALNDPTLGGLITTGNVFTKIIVLGSPVHYGSLISSLSEQAGSAGYCSQMLNLPVIVDGETGIILDLDEGNPPSLLYRTGTRDFINNRVRWSKWGVVGGGSGDMQKSVYDTNSNGIVDNAEMLNGKLDTDFATAAQGAKADTAIQGVFVNNAERTPDLMRKVNIAVPTKVSDIENDSGFQTGLDVKTVVAEHNGASTAHGDIRSQFNNYVPKSGAAMSGALLLSGSPTTDMQAVPKKYLDDKITEAVNGVLHFKGFISPTEPSIDVREGNFWYVADLQPNEAPNSNFAWQVKTYTGGSWSTGTTAYTPSFDDQWRDTKNGETWYYAGDMWERLDFGGTEFNPEQFESSQGLLSLKSEAIETIVAPKVINLVNHAATVDFEVKPFVVYQFVDDTDFDAASGDLISVTDTAGVKESEIYAVYKFGRTIAQLLMIANNPYKMYWTGAGEWMLSDAALTYIADNISNNPDIVPSSAAVYAMQQEIITAFERVIQFEFPANVCRDYLKSAVTLVSAELRSITKLEYSTDGSSFTEIMEYPINISQGDIWWRVTYNGNDAVLTLSGKTINY